MQCVLFHRLYCRCPNLTGSGIIVDVDIVGPFGPFCFSACLLSSLPSSLSLSHSSHSSALHFPPPPSPSPSPPIHWSQAAVAMACAASVAATSASASLAPASAAAQSKLRTHNGVVLAAPARANNKAAVAFVANKARVSMRSAHSSTRAHSRVSIMWAAASACVHSMLMIDWVGLVWLMSPRAVLPFFFSYPLVAISSLPPWCVRTHA